MYWINFLHIYQPSGQSKEILERVANESYRPLFEGFLKLKNIKVNLNINGALTETLAKKGYLDIIKNIKKLSETKRLEFTESAKYHTLLPFLNKEEFFRQVSKNHKTNKKYFGKTYNPVCFFPPEMAYSENVGKKVSKLNYPMILLDEITYKGIKNPAPTEHLTTIENTKSLIAVFRERKISNCIMSAIVRNKKEFLDSLGDRINKNCYLCTAMDGETFGHHRPGLEKALFKILSSKKPEQIFISELPKHFKIKERVSPLSATWASSQEDIDKGVQFYSWKNPKNKVHQLQWKFLNYLLKISKNKATKRIKENIDKALASDQFFWASGEPWWSIEVIEKGAWKILSAFKSIPGLSKKQINKAEEFYREILSVAFWWQRSGKIGQMAKKYKENIKIPFRKRTLESSKPEVYYAFIELMDRKMKEAARNKNFEKAILWRDAIWKLETKNDIYDAIHAVDLLRKEVPDPKIRKLMDQYKEKYRKINPGQPERRRI